MTSVAGRLYITGKNPTSNDGQMALLGIDYSGASATVLIYKWPNNSNFKGNIACALAIVSTVGSEQLLMGGGYTQSNDDYRLTLIKYTATNENFSHIDFMANNGGYFPKNESSLFTY